MKQLDVTSLRKNITFSIALTVLVLIIISVVTTTLIQKHQQDQLKQEYHLLLHQSIESTIGHYKQNYTNRLLRLTRTTKLPEMLRQKDREGIERLLRPKWELMKEGEPYLAIMQLHLPDGTSFLRLHRPGLFGDQRADIRPMLKEVHRSHQMLSGYETGRQGTFYRIVAPVFDAQKTYIGALEIGLDMEFILHAVHQANGFSGLIFVKEKDLKHTDRPGDRLIDGCRLHSGLTPELKPIYNILASVNRLKEDTEITVGEKQYLTHLFVLNDFEHQAGVKILFFQDLSKTGNLSIYTLIGIAIIMVMAFVLLTLFIYRRIGIYQDEVAEVYRKQIEKIDESENRFQLLYEKAPIAYQSMDDNQNILIVNTQWVRRTRFYQRGSRGKRLQ
ncbi:MAG: cache domain-containing protein [Sulfurimonas sp.]